MRISLPGVVEIAKDGVAGMAVPCLYTNASLQIMVGIA
jgi:hypothetical protein